MTSKVNAYSPIMATLIVCEKCKKQSRSSTNESVCDGCNMTPEDKCLKILVDMEKFLIKEKEHAV